MKFYRLKDNSYLHMIAGFHQNISNRTKGILLLVRLSTVFWRFKNTTHQKVTKTNLIILANILTKSKNFQMKFYRLVDNSYLHIMARFHQNISNTTKVITLLVRILTKNLGFVVVGRTLYIYAVLKSLNYGCFYFIYCFLWYC